MQLTARKMPEPRVVKPREEEASPNSGKPCSPELENRRIRPAIEDGLARASLRSLVALLISWLR